MLAKTKLSGIEVLICESLTDSYITHDKFVLVNNELKEYDDVKEGIKNLKTSTFNQRFWFIYNNVLGYNVLFSLFITSFSLFV